MTNEEFERVKRYARAICMANGVDPDADSCPTDGPAQPEWEFYIPDAQAAIAQADSDADKRVAVLEEKIDTLAGCFFGLSEFVRHHIHGSGGSYVINRSAFDLAALARRASACRRQKFYEPEPCS